MLASAPTHFVSTGSQNLDVLLDGGFAAGNVYLIESRVPEVARQVVAWIWATNVLRRGHVGGIVFTEAGQEFARLLGRMARDLGAPGGKEAHAAIERCPRGRVRHDWTAAISDFERTGDHSAMNLIVADSVPTYRGDKSYDETRDVSLHGLTALARRFGVPVVAYDQEPPQTPDHIRAHSLQAIPGSGRITIRRRGRTGLGVPIDLPPGTVQQLAPRSKPDFLSGGDLLPDVMREPA